MSSVVCYKSSYFSKVLKLKKEFIIIWFFIGTLLSFIPFIRFSELFSFFLILLVFSAISLFIQFKLQYKRFKEIHGRKSLEKWPVKQIKNELIYSFSIGLIQVVILYFIGKLVFPLSYDFDIYTIYVCIVYLSQSFILNFLYHLLYLMQQNKHLKKEAQSFEKLSSVTQKKTLQDLVSPHFLFNSLNTAASIAADETEKAVEFVEKLSDLYKFILKNNENKLIELKEEIEIVEKYCYLIQTRFGKYFQIEIKIPKKFNKILIPPLALQNLVENAAKHNAVTRKKPLRLSIEIIKDYIVVINNINPKNTFKNESTNLGLNYIKTQIEQFSEQKIYIEKTDNNFKVKIPLIYPSAI